MKQAVAFPDLSASANQRPAACARCGRAGMGWHRALSRLVIHLKVTEAQVVQYQCEGCGASVTVTPPGLQAGCKHSARTKALSVVLWGLRLSYRDAAMVMKRLGLPISHVGVILNVRAMEGATMARHRKAASRIKGPVLGADETELKLSGNGVTLGFLTDPSTTRCPETHPPPGVRQQRRSWYPCASRSNGRLPPSVRYARACSQRWH